MVVYPIQIIISDAAQHLHWNRTPLTVAANGKLADLSCVTYATKYHHPTPKIAFGCHTLGKLLVNQLRIELLPMVSHCAKHTQFRSRKRCGPNKHAANFTNELELHSRWDVTVAGLLQTHTQGSVNFLVHYGVTRSKTMLRTDHNTKFRPDVVSLICPSLGESWRVYRKRICLMLTFDDQSGRKY